MLAIPGLLRVFGRHQGPNWLPPAVTPRGGGWCSVRAHRCPCGRGGSRTHTRGEPAVCFRNRCRHLSAGPSSDRRPFVAAHRAQGEPVDDLPQWRWPVLPRRPKGLRVRLCPSSKLYSSPRLCGEYLRRISSAHSTASSVRTPVGCGLTHSSRFSIRLSSRTPFLW